MKLNLGCGNDIREGYVNVDKYAEAADQMVDLEVLPWPWETNSVKEVLLRHVLEHLGQSTDLYLGIIKELYRVCAPGAAVIIEVPHPLHPDYLGDPTHCRPVTVEGLSLFNLDYANQLIAAKSIGTPLAYYMGVDFVVMENIEYWDHHRNILHASRITLKVRKDIKVAFMSHGVGDICMGLGTAHALADFGYRVTLVAQERFHDFIKACPYVHAVTETDRKNEIWTCTWNQLQARHQIDECIELCGVKNATDESKSMVVVVPQNITEAVSARFPGKDRIVIHPSASVPSRKWPTEYWQELADRLRAEGIEVVATGMTQAPWTAELSASQIQGVTAAFDFTLMESVALYGQSKLLISADSAPIQLAGLTECGIVGIYSVMAPEYRLPYRHGQMGWNACGIMTACSHAPCYPKMVADHDFLWSQRAVDIKNVEGFSTMIYNWCLNEEAPTSCMKAISVDEVFNKAMELYKNQPETN